MLREILEFAQTVGQVEESELSTLIDLCDTAQAELSAQLRDDICIRDCKGAFIIAAAWLALAGLCISRSEEQSITSWSAGDVSVKERLSSSEQANTYREHALRLMSPYIKDQQFAFVRVRG